MPKHRSIKQRLERAKDSALRLEIAQTWAREWEVEVMGIVGQLERAIGNDDYDLLCRSTGQLKEVQRKRMSALSNVLLLIHGEL